MKGVILNLCCFFVIIVSAQRDLTPGGRNKRSAFGKADYKDYQYFGMQFSGGPTYMMARRDINNRVYSSTDAIGRPINYWFDPAGRPGFFLEIGMAHFPKKQSRIAQRLKTTLISYCDWGLGAKLLGAKEKTYMQYIGPNQTIMSTFSGSGKFYNTHLYGRFSVHKNIYFGKRYFMDNGLGFNFDYSIFRNDEGYVTESPGDLSSLMAMQSFYKPFVWQLNYNLGFGIKLSRRSFLIPGLQVPILGLYQWRGGCGALKWYNSNYVPLSAQVKLIYLFEKKLKGCPPARGNEEDEKRNKEYLQNN